VLTECSGVARPVGDVGQVHRAVEVEGPVRRRLAGALVPENVNALVGPVARRGRGRGHECCRIRRADENRDVGRHGGGVGWLVVGDAEIDEGLEIVLFDIRQQVRVGGEAIAVVTGWQAIESAVIVVHGQAELLEVVRALHAGGGFANFLHGW